MRYALTSAVLTSPGLYRYRFLSPEKAGEWWRAGPVEARIGYRETCAAISRVIGLGAAPAVDRRSVKMQPGDEALVFRLDLPPDERRLAVRQKGKIGLKRLIEACEIGLLVREE